jgi:hypothetical protein
MWHSCRCAKQWAAPLQTGEALPNQLISETLGTVTGLPLEVVRFVLNALSGPWVGCRKLFGNRTLEHSG